MAKKWLMDKETGLEVLPGEEIKSFRGEIWKLQSWQERPAPSNGRVNVVREEGGELIQMSYYPSVFNLEIRGED